MRQRILFTGSLRPGGNGLDRVAMFEAAGFDVQTVDAFPHIMTGSRIERSLAARRHLGRGVVAYNQALNKAAERGGYDIVYVEKGTWIWPDTLRALKKGARDGRAIHYTGDAQFLENRSRHFFAGLPDYDLAVTTKPFELDMYREAGAREVLLIHQGHGQRLAPVPRDEIPPELLSEVCFIGHCQPAYAHVMERLAARVPLTIWGPRWPEFAQQNAWARDVVRGSGVYGPDYARALSGAKIAVGLLSKRIPETTTTRSFEIPACGTLLLAERTDDHRALFEEGREAEFFEGVDELCDKAERYLADPHARERIAAAGRARCVESGYSFEAQFAAIFRWIQHAGTAARQTGVSA